MTRILFVDDEQHVLDGLRRLLRSQRSEWELEFVSDPFKVLPLLDEHPTDVVVSDMRMPGMDGLSLLQVVKARHPGTVRIILSGQFDQKTSIELIGVAHQYLAKPCDPDLLKDVVARAIELRSMLSSESLLELVSGIASLPSVPALYTELMRLVKSPDSSLADVGDVIADDTAMTAKVLQLVNSSFFGLRRTVTDPRQAVSLLGLDNIVALAMSSQVFSRMARAAEGGLSLEREHDRTMAVAVGARAIASEAGIDDEAASAFFLAGMLHDVGRLVLASNFPRRYRTAIPDDLESGLVAPAEESEFGASHSNVGAYLLGVWGLPDAIIEAAAYHHAPSQSAIRRLVPLTAVHVAHAVVESGLDAPTLDMGYLEGCGVTAQIEGWIAAVRAGLPEVEPDEIDELAS